MGGNALSVYTRRYQREEYLDILLEVTTLLHNNGIISEVPKWYSNKDSFGDLDVLVKSSTVNGSILNVINEVFKPKEIYNNGSVKSFDYKELQIDFIMVKDSMWETSINYFSYNDLSNLIGRITYQMGFRFGDYGLKLVYLHEDGGRKFEKIISTDPEKIYEFLGFSYERYLKGFDDLEDIFKFIVTSKRFNREVFNYEYLNHVNRTRNKKRKNYELFLNYIKESDNILPFDYIYKSKDFYITLAENFFHAELRKEIERWNEIVDQEKRASAIFNGNVVMEYFPLKGKELGEAMKKFKNYFDSHLTTLSDEQKKLHYSRWILDNNLDTILGLFADINNLNYKND